MASDEIANMFTQNMIKMSLGVQNANSADRVKAAARDTPSNIITLPTGRDRHGEKEYMTGSEQEAIAAITTAMRSHALRTSRSRVIENILLSV